MCQSGAGVGPSECLLQNQKHCRQNSFQQFQPIYFSLSAKSINYSILFSLITISKQKSLPVRRRLSGQQNYAAISPCIRLYEYDEQPTTAQPGRRVFFFLAFVIG
jgi:hypothetical protein